MRMMTPNRRYPPGRASLASVSLVLVPALWACGEMATATRVTSPLEQFGHEIGADYVLPNYVQLTEYWELLASESDRMTLESIGRTEEGREQLMATITSPGNHRNLARYKDIAERMAHAEGVSEAEARAMAAEGRAVVWIDGGLHANEVLGAQQLMELVYHLVSSTADETMRILDDVVVLVAHANPDGHDLLANWYMRIETPEERSTGGVPVLYQKYAGHDNNRDFYMSALAETTNVNRIIAREWFPQIVYNHHQTGPLGTVMFAPPFRDPPNHYLDPLILTGLDQVGSAMHQRFVLEGKGGTTMRSGASYSTWWNGGLRTTPYFKNQIGLLTETIGNPTPIAIPFLPRRQLPHGDLPLPVEPGVWHFRQSVDYSMTANLAVLDFASRNKDHLLFNIWRMGTNSIERGSRDHWTVLPFEIDEASETIARMGSRDDYERLLRDPADRDPRGFILPSDQPDFPTATRFVNALLKGGVQVHRATADFEVGGTSYPAESLVVLAAQAFRPHVLDMFEPQNHPNDFPYPGAPPTAPYDNAGWTLAYQMGVEFDRILDGFDGPFEPIEWLAETPPGMVAGAADAAGYLVSHDANDAFVVVNRVLAAGGSVHWMRDDFQAGGAEHPAGTFFVSGAGADETSVSGMAAELGIDFAGVESAPAGRAFELTAPRIALGDFYGGSMPSGWTRMILEDFEFDFDVVFPPDLDQGDLIDRFDVLVLEDGAVPLPGRDAGRTMLPEFAATVPDEYRGRIGAFSSATTVPAVLDFIRAGGTVVAIGSSTALAYHAGLPVRDYLVGADGQPLPSEEYYVPGSVLDLRVDGTHPLAAGVGERANVLFSRSPVFGLQGAAAGVTPVGWFDTDAPLRSGWAWGQHHLQDGVSIADARVGEGRLLLFGPKITFRAQSHGTFPFLFNGIHYGAAREVILPNAMLAGGG